MLHARRESVQEIAIARKLRADSIVQLERLSLAVTDKRVQVLQMQTQRVSAAEKDQAINLLEEASAPKGSTAA